MEQTQVITVKNLLKRYKKLTAVNNISFAVNKGEIFGLLGENGAGKTTTLEMIEGLRKATSGEVSVLGFDVASQINQIKHRIGIQLQSSAYFEHLTLCEILELFGSFYDRNISAQKLLKMVELEQKSNAYIKQLSGGQKQRFSIVASLVNDPEIVFLDEPTTGLDPVSRRKLWQIISDIKKQGKTVVLTTHYLEEAEILCDRIGIMLNGKIIALDETHKLIEQAKYPYVVDFFARDLVTSQMVKLKKLGEVKNVAGKVSHYEVYISEAKNLFPLLDIIKAIKAETITVGRATLEDVFIELTGKTKEDVEEERDV